MTNPNNAVGTNAAYSGRTSVNAFNDDLAAYGRGVLSGWACSPSTGLKVQLGGSGITRDVAVAVDNAGNRTTINNISGAPIEMTISAAPSTNSRIDAIVAYVDNPAEGVSTVADNPAACGMIVVKGTAAASPVEPNETMIRSAITADGASGVTAYYVVLATVTIASGTTDLTSSNIAAGSSAGIGSQNIDWTTLGAQTLDISGSSSPWTEAARGTITVSPGTYLVLIQGQIDFTQSGAYGATIRARLGEGTSGTTIAIAGAWMGNSYDTMMTGFGFVTVTEDTIITYTDYADTGSNSSLSMRKMAAIRIG